MTTTDDTTLPISTLSVDELAARQALWQSFRDRWPIEALRSMTLEQYTNLDKDDSFTYWVESRLEDLGSIWGSPSFKFGIYRRGNDAVKESGTKYVYEDEYAWRAVYGDTKEEAFAKVRELIVLVAEHARDGAFEKIDDIEITPLYRWKIAFLYQDPAHATLVPIFARKALFQLYLRHVDANATRKLVPESARYRKLRERYASITDSIELGARLWADFEAAGGASEVELAATEETTAARRVVETGSGGATSLVLFGPPGTGKTFATTRRALELIHGEAAVDGLRDGALREDFQKLCTSGRIAQVTFHQSYGYEDFVEGIRPVIGESVGDQVRYELKPGLFKQMALRAAGAGLRRSTEEPSFELLWTELQRRIGVDEGRVFVSSSGNEYLLRATAKGNFESSRVDGRPEGKPPAATEANMKASRALAELWWTHRVELGNPEGLTYERTADLIRRVRGGSGGHHYTPQWILYRELHSLRREMMTRATSVDPSEVEVQLAIDEGRAGRFRFGSDTPQYVLIIDEINRGNISKILGELITLLDPDKRLTAPNEARVRLASSSEHWFAVPPNLHIVATMNTADRSIALMDVALRRRFDFEEVTPDLAALRGVLLDAGRPEALVQLIVDLLEMMNQRIELLYDRDHQIGHAYFMRVTGLESLRDVFRDRIVPLLAEYFYGRWDRVATVLGCPYDDNGKPLRGSPAVAGGAYLAPLITARSAKASAILGYVSDDHEDRPVLRLSEKFVDESISKTDLARYFAGILVLEPTAYEARVATLGGGV
jgi:5-methylcytosine-specific restriction protein B